MTTEKRTPAAEVSEDFVFFLRKQDNGSRWPVGTKLYAERDMHEVENALHELVAQIEAGQSPDYAALQEHRVMRNARAAIAQRPRVWVEMEGTGIQGMVGQSGYVHVGLSHCEDLLRRGLAIPRGPRAEAFVRSKAPTADELEAARNAGILREQVRGGA